MQFLADVFVPCEQCEGRRFKQQVLEVKYKGKSIMQVLDMTVREALTFFGGSPKVLRRLQVLDEIGLGYLRLGQPATTLSGGEAQRIKIADWIIDLGPEGGDSGGEVIAMGTPEQVAHEPKSHTGRYLQQILSSGK